VSCDPPSGAFYPLGTTTVTCTATDSEQADQLQRAGLDIGPPPMVRAALTATGSFTITVIELPATTVPAPTIPATTIDQGAVPPTPTAPPGGELPATGSNILNALAVAAILIATGLVVLAARRRGPAA
jgi:LPXTG-motif cell wall-anchored protein